MSKRSIFDELYRFVMLFIIAYVFALIVGFFQPSLGAIAVVCITVLVCFLLAFIIINKHFKVGV